MDGNREQASHQEGTSTSTVQEMCANCFTYFFVCFLPVLKNMLGKCSTTKLHTQPLSLMAQLSFPKSEPLNYTDKVDMHIPNTVPGQAELASTYP